MAMPRIFDCFTFLNEFDLLEIRLHELAPVVDRFVIAESPVTFTGRPKPLHFLDNRARFAAFADKIIHIVVDDQPVTDSAWEPGVAPAQRSRSRYCRCCVRRSYSPLRS
jgi:hypothetical protein